MKLWQRTFLLTFACAFVLFEILSLVLFSHSFSSLSEKQRNEASASGDAALSRLVSEIRLERSQRDTAYLDGGEVPRIFEQLFGEGEAAVALLDSSGGVVAASDAAKSVSEVFAELPHTEEGERYILLAGDADNAEFAVFTGVELEGERYTFLNTASARGLYEHRTASLVKITLFCFCVSVFAAVGFALFIYFSVTRRIVNVGNKLTELERGRNTSVLPESADELGELCGRVNSVCLSVADNTERLSNIADSRKQFIDNLAHEMKTPLTSIMGFADILRIKRSVDERSRMEYAGIIVEETKRLKGLSGKLLELATTDSVNLEFENISADVLFEEVRISVLPMLALRHQTLSVAPAPVVLRIDRELFKSLLYNLIDNASKASPAESEIRLYCETNARVSVVSVADDGIGMTPEQVKRVTEPFFMIDKSRSRRAGGAGLGLALCEEIVKRHNGRLIINSRRGRGTTVSAAIPAVKGGRAV